MKEAPKNLTRNQTPLVGVPALLVERTGRLARSIQHRFAAFDQVCQGLLSAARTLLGLNRGRERQDQYAGRVLKANKAKSLIELDRLRRFRVNQNKPESRHRHASTDG